MTNQKNIKKRYFTVVMDDGEELGRFSGAAPRNAALKIARQFDEPKEREVTFTIRELGTGKYSTYNGWVVTRDRTESDPDWVGDVVNVPHVEKFGYSVVK